LYQKSNGRASSRRLWTTKHIILGRWGKVNQDSLTCIQGKQPTVPFDLFFNKLHNCYFRYHIPCLAALCHIPLALAAVHHLFNTEKKVIV
jgi:hypothetical protein